MLIFHGFMHMDICTYTPEHCTLTCTHTNRERGGGGIVTVHVKYMLQQSVKNSSIKNHLLLPLPCKKMVTVKQEQFPQNKYSERLFLIYINSHISASQQIFNKQLQTPCRDWSELNKSKMPV